MSKQDLSLVPGKEHYAAKYVLGGRLFSYAHQMNAVLEHKPRTVLEIGPGPGMVTAAMRSIDVEVTTVDVQRELKPDVVASVTDLPFENHSFDVSMCCQVLEHLPFEQFVPALRELGRVSRTALLVSVPDARPHYYLSFKFPGVKTVRLAMSRQKKVASERINRSWTMAGHYWEIGYPNVKFEHIMHAINTTNLQLLNNWRPADMSYHHFFNFSTASDIRNRSK